MFVLGVPKKGGSSVPESLVYDVNEKYIQEQDHAEDTVQVDKYLKCDDDSRVKKKWVPNMNKFNFSKTSLVPKSILQHQLRRRAQNITNLAKHI